MGESLFCVILLKKKVFISKYFPLDSTIYILKKKKKVNKIILEMLEFNNIILLVSLTLKHTIILEVYDKMSHMFLSEVNTI